MRPIRRHGPGAPGASLRHDPSASLRHDPVGDEPILQVHDLEVRYQGALGVGSVSLEVRQGECVAILGANGAGKTTTLRAISGFVPGDRARISRGTVTVAGSSTAGKSPSEMARRGVALVPERSKVFARLTVWQNLLVVDTGRPVRSEALDQVTTLFPVLGERAKQLAGSMSGGERQMLAIARALLLDPSLLLIDELSFGLAPVVIDEIIDKLLQLSTDKRAIVVVEQSAAVAAALASRAYVLSSGKVVAHGPIDEILATSTAETAYLGMDGTGR